VAQFEESSIMKVNEIARAAGVSAETVRYYSRIGLLRPERDEHNDYRRFKERDLCALRFIVQVKGLGFNLRDIRLILERALKGQSVCPVVRQTLEQRLHEKQEEMRRLQSLLHRMQGARSVWRDMPDQEPGERQICHLVDSLDGQALTLDA
jgi:DNA-binding transcriptional MerR regulator